MDPKHGDALVEIEDALENYPVLDDEDHSQREYDAINEAWDMLALSDRMDYAVENGHSMFAARRGDAWSLNNDCGDAVYNLIRN